MRSHSILVSVPFHDVDSMQIVWHGHYVKYFELARCALLESFNYGYRQMRESGFGWPVVDLHVRYARPLAFEQEFRVTARLTEWESRLKVTYEIHDTKLGVRLTSGSTTQVAVDLKTGETLFASPPVLFERLGLVVP